MADVFVSYSRRDREFVRQLHNALANIGRDTWIDWEDIPPTAEWLKEIFAGIEAADTFIFVISPDSVISKVCREELAHAIKHNKRIVPIVRREVSEKESIPQELRVIEWLYFREYDDFDAKFQELIKVLDTHLEWVKAHTRLLTRAIEWENKGFDASLLLRGSDLRNAYEWLAQAAATNKEPKPTALQTQYVLASRKSEVKRQRIVLGSITIALITTIILALAALVQRNEAIYQRQSAQARQLAAQSDLIWNQDPSLLPLSTLLAIESLSRRPSLGGDQALRRALSILPRLITYKKNPSERPYVFELDINVLTFSPDGRWLAIGTQDGTIRLWDSSTWQEKWKVSFGEYYGVVPTVRDLAFSPDSHLLASGRDIGTEVWDVATGRQVARMSDNGQVFSVAFSPDGRWVASGADHVVHVWEATTGREISRVNSSSEIVRFSPDGRLVASGGSDGTITVWEAATGNVITIKKQVTPTRDFNPAISALVFSPDGHWIASGDGERWGSWMTPRTPIGGTILIWEATTGKEIARFNHTDAISERGLAFSPAGKWLASGSFDSTVRVWDVEHGQKVGEFVHDAPVNVVTFIEEGRWVVATDLRGMARMWDVISGIEIARMTTELPVSIDALAQRPNTNQIAIGDERGGVWIWEILGHEVAKMKHRGPVSTVAFSPDGKLILTASWDKTARIWDATTGHELSHITDDGEIVTAIFSPDGQYLATGSLAGVVQVWETSTGHEVMHVQLDSEVGSIAFSPDSRRIAVAEGSFPRDGWFIFKLGRRDEHRPTTVTVWDITTKQEVSRLRHEHFVNSVAFSPNGKWLISGSDDRTARVWDVETGTEISRVYHKYRVNLVSFSPDGKWAASAESCFYVFFQAVPCKPVIKVWDPNTVHEIWQSVQSAPWISVLTFSPDSRMVAIANSFVYGCPPENCDSTVQVWDVATGKELGKVIYPNGIIPITAAFSPDGHWIASGGGDEIVRIWNPATGEEVSRIATLLEVWTGAFSPDGRWIAVGGYETKDYSVARVFPLLPEDLINAACSRLSRNLTPTEWQQYVGSEPYRLTCPNLPAPPEAEAASEKPSSSDVNQPNGYSGNPVISADGNFIVFTSDASNLICGDSNRSKDVFVYDRQAGKVSRVSVASDGTQANDDSYSPSISANGRYVVFISEADTLAPIFRGGMFIHDRESGQTAILQPQINGKPIRYPSEPAISGDGRYIVFKGYSEEKEGIFIYDRETEQTNFVASYLDRTSANVISRYTHVSDDEGRYVVFEEWEYSSDEIAQIFVLDLNAGQKILASSALDGTKGNGKSKLPAISANGRYVAFESTATNLVSNDTNGSQDIFVFDIQTRQLERVSVNSGGSQLEGDSSNPSISADGRFVTFVFSGQILLRDRQTGETTRVLAPAKCGE